MLAAAETVDTAAAVSSFAPVTAAVFWYTGSTGSPLFTPGAAAAAHDFSTGGYVMWAGATGSGLTAKICMDVGPLGLGALAAHGHADALALTMHINGEPLFIDCGTYAYHGEPLWRAYFKGTRAHNTLRINHQDQARMSGPFLWRQPYRVFVHHAVASEDQFDVVAEHDGYLNDGDVMHRRHVAWHPLHRRWVIEDVFMGPHACAVELLLHVHPDRRVVVDGTTARVYGTGYCLHIQFPAELTLRSACGELDPPLGWYSPRLGVKMPCTTLCASGRVEPHTNMTTWLSIEPAV